MYYQKMHDVCTLKCVVQVEHRLPLAEYLYQAPRPCTGSLL